MKYRKLIKKIYYKNNTLHVLFFIIVVDKYSYY